MQDIQLSPNFLLSEFTASSAAARNNLKNEPTGAEIDNLRRLANKLEAVRRSLRDKPISVLSGFRSRNVNTAVGGATNSAHMDGLAADFICPAFGTPRQIVQHLLDDGLSFDQLIFEGTWVHIGLAKLGAMPRGEVLTAAFKPGADTTYLKGLV